jgi:hypothetical protein
VLPESIATHATTILAIVVGAVLLLITIVALRRFGWLWKSAPAAEEQSPPEPLPLTTEGPTGNGPHIYLHGVRLCPAIVVIAPVGRGSPLPQADELPALFEQVVPGLSRVLTTQSAKIKLWPPQLSVQGFVQAFFTHYRLPGDRGKGTSWCLAAGKIEAGGRPLLLGLALAAAAPNSLSQFVVQHEAEWPRLLEIR